MDHIINFAENLKPLEITNHLKITKENQVCKVEIHGEEGGLSVKYTIIITLNESEHFVISINLDDSEVFSINSK